MSIPILANLESLPYVAKTKQWKALISYAKENYYGWRKDLPTLKDLDEECLFIIKHVPPSNQQVALQFVVESFYYIIQHPDLCRLFWEYSSDEVAFNNQFLSQLFEIEKWTPKTSQEWFAFWNKNDLPVIPSSALLFRCSTQPNIILPSQVSLSPICENDVQNVQILRTSNVRGLYVGFANFFKNGKEKGLVMLEPFLTLEKTSNEKMGFSTSNGKIMVQQEEEMTFLPFQTYHVTRAEDYKSLPLYEQVLTSHKQSIKTIDPLQKKEIMSKLQELHPNELTKLDQIFEEAIKYPELWDRSLPQNVAVPTLWDLLYSLQKVVSFFDYMYQRMDCCSFVLDSYLFLIRNPWSWTAFKKFSGTDFIEYNKDFDDKIRNPAFMFRNEPSKSYYEIMTSKQLPLIPESIILKRCVVNKPNFNILDQDTIVAKRPSSTSLSRGTCAAATPGTEYIYMIIQGLEINGLFIHFKHLTNTIMTDEYEVLLQPNITFHWIKSDTPDFENMRDVGTETILSITDQELISKKNDITNHTRFYYAISNQIKHDKDITAYLNMLLLKQLHNVILESDKLQMIETTAKQIPELWLRFPKDSLPTLYDLAHVLRLSNTLFHDFILSSFSILIQNPRVWNSLHELCKINLPFIPKTLSMYVQHPIKNEILHTVMVGSLTKPSSDEDMIEIEIKNSYVKGIYIGFEHLVSRGILIGADFLFAPLDILLCPVINLKLIKDNFYHAYSDKQKTFKVTDHEKIQKKIQTMLLDSRKRAQSKIQQLKEQTALHNEQLLPTVMQDAIDSESNTFIPEKQKIQKFAKAEKVYQKATRYGKRVIVIQQELGKFALSKRAMMYAIGLTARCALMRQSNTSEKWRYLGKKVNNYETIKSKANEKCKAKEQE